MDHIPIVYPDDWTDYELINTGSGMKLERFGNFTVSRPDPRILWPASQPDKIWNSAGAIFTRTNSTTGYWTLNYPPPNPWIITYKNLRFSLRPTEFKHMGIFPEQAVNWNWLTGKMSGQPLKILNLFAYTGGASLASALAGARVTHVDSVKSTLSWAKKNVQLSGIPTNYIRWIEDDAYKFVLRESRRGTTYDGIILDPPRFGRGPRGEVWKIETNLPQLLSACCQILSPQAKFILLNAYTADLSSIALHQLLTSIMSSRVGHTSSFELTLKSAHSPHLLPSGIIIRWENS